ncbi:MAG: hypothetical protein R2697_15800 [Ilumatobacteraceae bacterium]
MLAALARLGSTNVVELVGQLPLSTKGAGEPGQGRLMLDLLVPGIFTEARIDEIRTALDPI